jgi:predicted RNA polymerase sigma factor
MRRCLRRNQPGPYQIQALSRLGRTADAAAEYDAAIALADSAAQHRFLTTRRAALHA